MMIEKRLLEAAIREFGEKGRDGASTRAIAAKAGTAMSSITYHYGSKEGLYLAATDYIAAKLGLQVTAAAEPGNVPGNPTDARNAIKIILRALADRMISDVDSGWTLFIIREQMAPSEAFERLYDGAMRGIVTQVTELVRIATGCDDREAANLVTFTLFCQVSAMRSSRASFLRLMERDKVTDRLAAALKEQIIENADAILDRLERRSSAR